MDEKEIKRYSNIVDEIYDDKKFENAISSYASFFSNNNDEVLYSNLRHDNSVRNDKEREIWRKYIAEGSKILDIGCGTGYYLKKIYNLFDNKINYFGIDISNSAIKIAKNTFPSASFKLGVAEKLPYKENEFDYVQIITAIENMIEPNLVINEALRVLKPGGFFYLVIHKKSIDPLIISTVYNKIKYILRDKKKNKKSVKYTISNESVRLAMNKNINEKCNLIINEAIVPSIDIKFYRKIKLPMWFLTFLFKIINYLPFPIFKNLEHYVYKKNI